jgi:hypothetical protein
VLSIRVFTAVLHATHTKSFKIQNFKTQLFQVLCLYLTHLLHNMFSAYLAIFRRIKIVGEIVACMYTVITHVTFSQFYDLNLKSEL